MDRFRSDQRPGQHADHHSDQRPDRHCEQRSEQRPDRRADSACDAAAHEVAPVRPAVLTSLAAATTALLATAGVLIDRGTLAPPLTLAPAVLTILLMTLGAGLAAVTVSAAWQGRGVAGSWRDGSHVRTAARSGRQPGHTESAGSPAGPT